MAGVCFSSATRWVEQSRTDFGFLFSDLLFLLFAVFDPVNPDSIEVFEYELCPRYTLPTFICAGGSLRTVSFRRCGSLRSDAQTRSQDCHPAHDASGAAPLFGPHFFSVPVFACHGGLVDRCYAIFF